MLFHVGAYVISFVAIWVGAGFIVSSIERFSNKLKLSRFAISFVLLGLLTSIPEFAVGLQAIAENDAEVFVGNLLGGIPVIFLFVIPILAIFGNGINLQKEVDEGTFFVSALVILAPFLLILDKRITNIEGVVCILLYIFLLIVVQRKHGLFDKEHTNIQNLKAYSYKDLMKILLGIALVFISSGVIVNKTVYFSEVLGISPFYMSLIVLSIGTNLPELSLAVRSVYQKNKTVAFGDYVGSAAVNTLFFGIFTLMNNGEVLTVNNFLATYFFIAFGLWLFYIFSLSKRTISRHEGFALLGIYILFIVFEAGHYFK